METTTKRSDRLEAGDVIVDPQGRGTFEVASIEDKAETGTYTTHVKITWTDGQVSILHRALMQTVVVD